MEGLEQVCAQAQNAVEAFSEVAPDMARLAERGAALLLRLSRFQGLCPEGYVRWLEAGGGLRLVESPLDIAEAMRTRLLATAQEAVDEDGWPAPARGPPVRGIAVHTTRGESRQSREWCAAGSWR